MKILKEQLNDVKIFDKVNLGTLNFYPLKFNLNNSPENLKSLDELFDLNLVKINEVDFDGSVGHVEVYNKSNQFLFILDGEAILGAKQNRVAERSIIVAPDTETILPVNCVEKGRWNYNSDKFSKSDFVLHPKARDKKAELLKEKQDYKVQEAVWDNIDQLSEKHQVHSYTSDLGDILNRSGQRFDFDYFDKIKNLDINGYVLEGAGRSFIEVFFDKKICKSYIKKSVRSWVIDNDEDYESSSLDIHQFVDEFMNSSWDKDTSISVEKNFSSNVKNSGRCFFFDDNLIHAYYYK